MEPTSLLWPAVLLLLLLFLLYKYGTRTHGTLERLGIPVVKPYPFVGSVPRLWKVVSTQEDVKNARRYGKVWGQYEGITPQVFIADVEMAKRILIKDFEYFMDRPNFLDFEVGRDMMDVLKGERWKAVRSILSPTLASGAKLKAMTPTLQQCTDEALQLLEKKMHQDPIIRLKDTFYGPLVLDFLAQFLFGMKVPGIYNPKDPFVNAASSFGGIDAEFSESTIAGIMTFFPIVSNYVLARMFVPPLKFFMGVLHKSVKERRAGGIDRPDLVGALMDAIDNKVPTKEFRDLNISEDVLLIQGAEMLMSAYDTTGATLILPTYYLVKHPDVMQRVIDEFAEVAELTYESVRRLPLLEAVLHETLRMTPIVPRHVRLCVHDWEYNGLRSPAGTWVIIPLWPYHYDETVFPEPERFVPDRWLGDAGRALGQYHWMPFGLGPRACNGMRLAMVECMFVLASLLKRYRLSATGRTQLIYAKGVTSQTSFQPIFVKVDIKR